MILVFDSSMCIESLLFVCRRLLPENIARIKSVPSQINCVK
jgi:hypothetical protein